MDSAPDELLLGARRLHNGIQRLMRRKNRARTLLDEHEMLTRAAAQNQIEAHRWKNKMRTRPQTTGGGEKVLEENNCRSLHNHKERPSGGEPKQEQRTSLLQQSKSMREKYPERKSQRLHSRADESRDPRKIKLVAAVEKFKYARKESKPAPVAHGRYQLRPKAIASLGGRTETESSPVVGTGGAHSSLTLTRDTNHTRGTRRHGGGKS
jgi:hypothetical protein